MTRQLVMNRFLDRVIVNGEDATVDEADGYIWHTRKTGKVNIICLDGEARSRTPFNKIFRPKFNDKLIGVVEFYYLECDVDKEYSYTAHATMTLSPESGPVECIVLNMYDFPLRQERLIVMTKKEDLWVAETKIVVPFSTINNEELLDALCGYKVEVCSYNEMYVREAEI